MVITGITGESASVNPTAKTVPQTPDRSRVSVDLSPSVSLLLDHVCEVTGSNKNQVVLTALMDALPGLLERAEALQKRSAALALAQAKKGR